MPCIVACTQTILSLPINILYENVICNYSIATKTTIPLQIIKFYGEMCATRFQWMQAQTTEVKNDKRTVCIRPTTTKKNQHKKDERENERRWLK